MKNLMSVCNSRKLLIIKSGVLLSDSRKHSLLFTSTQNAEPILLSVEIQNNFYFVDSSDYFCALLYYRDQRLIVFFSSHRYTDNIVAKYNQVKYTSDVTISHI